MERQKTAREKLVSWFDALNNQVMDLKQAESRLQETNQKMADLVNELKTRTSELSQLGEMVEQLQSCQSIEETCSISARYIQKFFPDSRGALYIINASKDSAEAANIWGDPISTEKIFMPLNCWAIRRGQPHQIDSDHPGLLCGHITDPKANSCLCVPMLAHGEVLGILYLDHSGSEKFQQKSINSQYSEHILPLAATVCKNIALALSNQKIRETLRQESIRDILTGLFNRRYMEESLTRELSWAKRDKKPLGIIMFDIDHFKDFNDNFGHDVGDALLRELGGFLLKRTRAGDIVSRYGGDEFVIVYPRSNLEDTRLQAEKLRQGVKDLQINHLGKPLTKCTISLGVAVFPEHGLTREVILKSADTALYRAKNEGRDMVTVVSPHNLT
jgi:diguanylate cyclase (GGDEF)-like protein